MRSSAELTEQLCAALTMANSALPHYKQLYEALRQQIIDGLLLPGMCLPSSRVLSKQLNLSRNTASAAIDQLCAEGYAAARAKSGVYILATAPTNWQINKNTVISSKIKKGLSLRGEQIAKLAYTPPARGAFAGGVPDLKQFPFALWQRYILRHARNPKLDWQMNTNQGGDLELRQTMANYLRISRGISCTASQILITHGTQHSLALCADLLADQNDMVWMENPGYTGARCAFAAADLTIINQPVDADGISPAENAWQNPARFIYTTPSHQFPTGVVMSAARRRHLLAKAAQHNTWIIEDDYDSEFRYEAAPIAALHALAPDQVIYLGTFSKMLFPALRIGYMVLPEQLFDAFRMVHARHLREPSYIVQKALADFIRDGHASSHIRKMRREYQTRRDILVNVLKTELGDSVRLEGLETGMHLVVYLPKNLDDQAITEQALAQSVLVAPLSRYYHANNLKACTPALILGFGDADQKIIPTAAKIVTNIIKTAI